jgi:hypothetical protein
MRNPRLIFANARTDIVMAAFNHTANALRYNLDNFEEGSVACAASTYGTFYHWRGTSSCC